MEIRPRMEKPHTPKSALIIAGTLAAVGLFRFFCDSLTDMSPGWADVFGESWIKYLFRRPEDGTTLGYLNVQFFKALAVPCGISCIFIFKRMFSVDLRVTQKNWERPGVRAMWLGAILIAALLTEVEKTWHVFGLKMEGNLAGEDWRLNFAIHFVTASITWFYMRWLRFIIKTPAKAGG
jgi:hypothetical protein